MRSERRSKAAAVTLRNKSVLITGASGFTGRHLSAALIEFGAVVHGFSSSSLEGSTTVINGQNVVGCLTKPEALENAVELTNPDYVVHLAGISFANHENALPYYNVNVLGTENLLKACESRASHIQRIVIASSAAVYGYPKNDFVSEEDALMPVSHYGVSKLAMEHIARSYGETLPLTIVRPFNYTGPGQPEHFLLPKIVKHFSERKAKIELGNSNIIREFSDVRDIVQYYCSLLQQDAVGTVNLCTAQSNSFADVINTLTEITDHQITIEKNPKFVRKNDLLRLVGSSTKLVAATERRPAYTLRDTLAAMLIEQNSEDSVSS